jgi:glucokinase
LSRQVRAHPQFKKSRLRRQNLDYAVVFRAAAKGDPLARELRGHAVRVWSAALVSMIHAYDPEVAVLGGGIMQARAVILPAVRRYVARHAWTPWGKVKVLPAKLGNDAGLIGAASLLENS